MSKVEEIDKSHKVNSRFSLTTLSSMKDSIKSSLSNVPSLPKKNAVGISRNSIILDSKDSVTLNDKKQSLLDGTKKRIPATVGTPTTPIVTKPEKQLKDPNQMQISISKDTKDPLALIPNSIDGPVEVHNELSYSKKPYQLSDFNIIKLVGKGGFAKVYKVTENKKNAIYALKVMRKDHVRKMKQVTNVMNEKNIQKESNNNFIVRILDTFQDSVHLFIVQEFLDGGDLFSFIKNNGDYLSCTNQALFIEASLFLLDLKPENILFGVDGHIKLADLGFAKKLNGGKTKSFCGTPSYLAPEMLERKAYGVEVDWWTFGVLIFQLCSGCSPFQENHPSKTFTRILNCAIRWPPDPQKYFTEIAFDIIMGLFEIDPVERLTEGEIKEHEWFEDINFEDMENKKVSPPSKVFYKKQEVDSPIGGVAQMGIEMSEGEMKESTDNLFLDF